MLPRERFAWVWLSGLVVICGTYFTAIAVHEPDADLAPLTQLGMLAAALVSLAVVALAARFMVPRRERGREQVAIDERDQLIELRSSAAAYYVLMGGMIVVGCVMPFRGKGWDLVHAALLAIVLAEIVHYGLVVLGYRRGVRA